MDPNAKNNDGDTPLHTACRNESSKQVKLLVRDERCNPHEKNSRGDTALHVACRRRYGGIHYFNYLFCLLFLTTHSVLVVVDCTAMFIHVQVVVLASLAPLRPLNAL